MEKNVREKDLRLLVDMSGEAQPQKPDDLSMRVLVPAFMMWSPRCCRWDDDAAAGRPLPFKLIFFVLVDGWTLVAGSLIQSYGT